MRIHGTEAGEIVLGRALVERVEVLADVESQNAAARGTESRPLHVGEEALDAVVVEAEAVDQRFGFRQTEESRLRISGLRARRHGAAFDEAEAEARQPVDVRRVLVESRREP